VTQITVTGLGVYRTHSPIFVLLGGNREAQPRDGCPCVTRRPDPRHIRALRRRPPGRRPLGCRRAHPAPKLRLPLPSRSQPPRSQPARRQPAPVYAPRHAQRRLARRGPSRLTLTAAAGTVTAFLGVGVALAATSSGPAGPASQPPATIRPPATAGPGAAQASAPAVQTTAAAGSTPAPAASGASAASPAAHARAEAATRRAARKRAREPFLIYDSAIPDAIPAGRIIATYADGPHPAAVEATAGAARVYWIDIEGTDTAAQAIDVEPGCASPLAAANWARAKLAADPSAKAIIYTMISEWPTVRADVATLPVWMQKRVRWWIADPTGQPHVVAGAQATQWYWGPKYDISTALASF
jgi:hypothetical protein